MAYSKENYPELEVTKIREGFYRVGVKKVHVYEKNDKILVRVGGGFSSMDQFF